MNLGSYSSLCANRQEDNLKIKEKTHTYEFLVHNPFLYATLTLTAAELCQIETHCSYYTF